MVIDGRKTATSSIYNGIVLGIREQSILTDFLGKKLAILELVDYKVLPFDEVTEEMAVEEGEGDKTLTYWRKVHKKFFCEELGCKEQNFDDKIVLLYEKFKVVKKYEG